MIPELMVEKEEGGVMGKKKPMKNEQEKTSPLFVLRTPPPRICELGLGVVHMCA